MKTAYVSIDAHARHCVMGVMNENGKYLGEKQFPTAEAELIRHITREKARRKILTVEEGPLAFWIGRTLEDYVDQVLICDPRENDLITRSANKRDSTDAYRLCRLLRLGELKEVYHPEEDHRAHFKSAVQHYLDLREQQKGLKNKIKAKYRGQGVIDLGRRRVYHPEDRVDYLAQVTAETPKAQLKRLYELHDCAVELQQEARREMIRLGRRYWEIREFQKMPGVGPIGAHVFDAYIQTPRRFSSKQKLWRYCGLGISQRSSSGQALGHERLDRSGSSELKAVSYRAWQTALQMKESNEVTRFYHASLKRTSNKVHARLNTQRKVLVALWAVWKHKDRYRPERF